VNKNGNNTTLPSMYPQINLQATHSKKYCFSSFKLHPKEKKNNHLQVATRQARVKVFILSNIQVKKRINTNIKGN